MPWVDICTSEQWSETVNKFASGQSRSRGKNFANVMRYLFTKKLPREVIELTQLIENYQNMEKRDLDNVQARQASLRAIANAGQRYLSKYRVTGRGGIERDKIFARVLGDYDRLMKKDRGFETQVRRMNEDVMMKHDRGTVTTDQASQLMEQGKQDLLKERAEAAYKKAKLESFDYAVAKVVRRATRKADYLAKLTQHLHGSEGTHKHMASGQQTLIQYIRDRSTKHIDADLVRLHSDEILEKVDPWHRNYDMSFRSQGSMTPNSSVSSIYGHAFLEWFRDEQHAGLPFFVWLEGHRACTGGGDSGPGTSVGYYMANGPMGIDSGPPASIHVLDIEGGVVKVVSICENEDVPSKPFDTQDVAGDRKTSKKLAYVWGRDNTIFVAPHKATEFHHSSFLSGKKVKCSGMIGAANGKITLVNNDSGHYKPSGRHLRTFVSWLDMNGFFTEDATVKDETDKNTSAVPVADFLAGKTGAGAQRMYNRLQKNEIDLRGLVEERFQQLGQASGRGQPEATVWKKAYVSVCNDLGQFDATYLGKAKAPPIPRTKAPRRPTRAV